MVYCGWFRPAVDGGIPLAPWSDWRVAPGVFPIYDIEALTVAAVGASSLFDLTTGAKFFDAGGRDQQWRVAPW